MKTKLVSITFSFLLLGLIGVQVFGNPLASNEPPKTVKLEAKTDGFDSLKELEDGSKIIVRGKKVGNLGKNLIKSKADNEKIAGGYAISNFEI